MTTSLVAFIFVIGILVFIHELGHFLVAKWSGVRVEKFSLGFGKKIFGFTRGETEYLICMLPLGGYVKMYGEGSESFIVDAVSPSSKADEAGFKSGDRIVSIDGLELKSFTSWKKLEAALERQPEKEYKIEIERDDEKIELISKAENMEGTETYAEKEYPRGFSTQPLLNRLAIVVAGPFMNFLLPFIFLPIVFMIGIAVPAYLEKAPEIGYIKPDSSAEAAGFIKGDTILEIEGDNIKNWQDANISIQTNPDVTVNVKIDRMGEIIEIPVKATTTPEGIVDIGFGEVIEAKVGRVRSGTPAANTTLQKGDAILKIDGTTVADWDHMASIIKKNPGNELTMLIGRAGSEPFVISITPDAIGVNGSGAIGIEIYRDEIVKKYGFFEAIVNGVKEAANMIIQVLVLLFGFLYKLVTGKIALGAAGKSLAGPILIAKISGAAAESGIAQLLKFTCFISINLAIINLFPIPMLDGGHVVYLTIEGIKKKPLSQRSMEISQKVGLTLLIFIMFVAIYNDLARVKGDIMHQVNRVVEVFR